MENAKIVVVDDDRDIRDSLQTILGGRNYTVVTAADREEGMEKIRTENPDLIILDVVMNSKLDGLEISKQLKKDPQFKVIPILMLTGSKVQTGFDFKPKEGGPEWCMVDVYLEKPIEPEVLLEEVEKLLSERA